ncbi:MAG: nickel-responsive transcriptional regulator NikR [Candidatus Methanomethyliales bacterium]|nr:nickel-responsive transcriptional regulator NikR [Candidatus Methanomethylicales archaeon]
MKKGVKRFSVSVPPELLEDFDAIIKKLGQDRSKAIQQSMRLFISEYTWREETSECAGALVLVYDHEVHEAEESLTDLQHEFREIINSTLHVHIDERNCLEILALRGKVERVKELINRISVCRGVKQIRHTVIELSN